jgi:hypothetical protein
MKDLLVGSDVTEAQDSVAMRIDVMVEESMRDMIEIEMVDAHGVEVVEDSTWAIDDVQVIDGGQAIGDAKAMGSDAQASHDAV